MTLLPGRLARVHSPCRIFTRPRHASTTSTQSGPIPTRRGGRDLGLRYQWLESSIRGAVRKATLLEETADTSHLPERSNSAPSRGSRASPKGMEVFHGLVVPKEPKPPESDECCMSGCAVCVYDLYEESLLSYQASLASLRTQLPSMGIPQTEWPSHIKSSPSSQATQRPPNTSLGAFEAMEEALKAKQQGRAKGGS